MYIHNKMTTKSWVALSALLAVGLCTQANAQISEELTGDQAMASGAPDPEAGLGSNITGSLSFDFNSHFISYGLDVWGEGGSWDNVLFNPSIGLSMAVTDNFYIFTGLWFDINDLANGDIGRYVQEVDVWLGGGYTYEEWTFELTYQAWMYGGHTESILDVLIAYDYTLNPTLIVHNRVDGIPGQDTGTVFVLGVSEGFEYEGFDFSAGFDFAFNTSDYYGLDGGFTYLALGVGVAYPLSMISEAYGAWNVHAGLTFYYTNEDTVPNPTETFLTGNIGFGVDF